MSQYNNNNNKHDDGNPFYNEPINTPQNNNQPQAIFTNTNINFQDYSAPSTQPNTSYQPNLQFQDFSHTTIDMNQHQQHYPPQQQPKIGSGGSGSRVPESDFYDNPNANLRGNVENPDEKKYSFYQVPYYRSLFNVDTKEVGFRLLRSMLPIKFSFFNLIRDNPDLYGPFWVLTTLVFVISVSSNLNDYFRSDHSEWQVDINIVVYSAIAVYGYSFLVPLILWGVFKWMKLGLRLLDMLCIYGYTLFIYIPASVLCVVPVTFVQWIIVGVASGVSGVFLVTNIFTPLKEDFTKRGIIICAIIGALHLGLALLLKLYFFANHSESLPSDITIPPIPTNGTIFTN